MKVLLKGKTPEGIDIQLEDWRDHNSEKFPDLYGLTIGAYPIAKNTGRYRFVISGDRFRLTIASNNYAGYFDEQVESDYNSLLSGEKKLEDLSDRFWNGIKDQWYLGMAGIYYSGI